jgi:hypothetical protein
VLQLGEVLQRCQKLPAPPCRALIGIVAELHIQMSQVLQAAEWGNFCCCEAIRCQVQL